MKLLFIVKEGFSGIGRAKLPAAVTVITGFFALLLLGVFATVSLSFFDIIEEVRGRVEIEAFFSDGPSEEDVLSVAVAIDSLPGVREVSYISREEAALLFQKEFGQDIVTILGTNPLPRSAKIGVEPLYTAPDSLQGIAEAVSGLQEGIELKYNRQFLSSLEENARLFTLVTAASGILISIATVVMVGYTIRLAMYSRKERIKTMRLVGATNWFIRAPYLIEGAIQGVLAGGLAALGLYLFFEQFLARYEPGIYDAVHPSSLMVYPVLTGLGFLLGVFGSSVSVAKYLRRD